MAEAVIKSVEESRARDPKAPVLRLVVGRTTSFQNYERCRDAYSRGYGIKFCELGLAEAKLRDLQSYIGYRHKIIHVSPFLGMLNQEKVPPEEPVFPKKETAERAKGCFREFIEALHQATLSLRPKA
jgi:hypothetical protein